MIVRGPIARDLIERGAAAHGDRTAVIVGDRELSFAAINSRANRLAQALHQAGIRPGERIALLVNNGPDSIPLDFACTKLGLNRVPLNARLSRAEHQRMMTEAQCRALIYGPDLAPRAQELLEDLPAVTGFGIGDTPHRGADLDALAATAADAAPDVAIGPDDILLTLYTSGTTGVLKAAQHSQASFAAVARNVLANLFPILPDERMMHAASLIHASGTFVLPFWLRGACNIVLPRFEPAAYLAAIARHRPTAINLVPTMLQMLLDHPDLPATDTASLRHIVYGASPMPRAVIDRAIAHFGQNRFWQFYGQTEAPLCIAVLRPEDHAGDRLGACGQPAVDAEIRLIDGEGRDVPPGEAGEILVRMPSAAAGYFNAPDLTAAGFDADGWVHTRDIGLFDDHGYLHLRDRTSDMIISGGYNIYPREVEDALLAHPAVREAAVVGLPDDKWVEAVTAFVVLRDGAAADEAELIAAVAGRIASYKKPHRIHFVDAIPKIPIGKVDRKALRRPA
ncbi:MAG: long-chain fatty acid--CoA ligase [Sphingopyxis macrogoltabida]|uniref:3-methylmercaptopropionyl-CoA ligase n=1 Tax=Sphingopyxis macrogoltabida TaxID=33050 RepID=A0A2W5NBJ9_SPHMC|nr:MAG: long-chain fatty acid--CoA ligase [Sphingopyxis macrogoltabida]